MTASVMTRGMKGACFTDEEREKMYLSTIHFYANKILINVNVWAKIVFVDNSGWDLTKMQKQLPQYETSIEFIALNPNLFDISKGKGYNELLLINLAIKQSQFIRESQAFLKVTGRYPVYNILYFLDYFSKSFQFNSVDLYIDIKDHKLYDRLHLGWNGHSTDVRLFGASVSFYTANVADQYKSLNDYDGHLLEGLMYDIVKPLIGNSGIICRFKKEPYYGGMEGSNVNAISFSKNQDSFKGKFKRFIGNFIRRFLPFFWF
jgi:hypothetical protein